MSLTWWVVTYLADLLFWLWVVRWGGAEKLEGTFSSGFLISILAPQWSEEGIKLFGYGAIVISTVLFVLGIFFADFRDMF
jgi:hypothetical protein